MKRLSNDQLKDAFEAIARANGGRLTPAAALASAKDKKSALAEMLPPDFWDDRKCSHKYRLHWFRSKIRSVRLVITTHEIKLNAPYYLRDMTCPPKEQGYIAAMRLRDDQDLSRETLLAEFGKVTAALERAYAIAASLNLQSEIGALRNQAEAIRARVNDISMTSMAAH